MMNCKGGGQLLSLSTRDSPRGARGFSSVGGAEAHNFCHRGQAESGTSEVNYKSQMIYHTWYRYVWGRRMGL